MSEIKLITLRKLKKLKAKNPEHKELKRNQSRSLTGFKSSFT